MREMDFVRQRDFDSLPDAEACRRPFTDAVERQDCRLLEGRWEKGARRVRFVMFGKDKPMLVLAAKALAHFARQMELLFQPQRHCLEERFESNRRVGNICFEQALKLQEWLVVKSNVI